MSARSQRTANRSTGLAIGLLVVFFLVAALGDWEGMIGLALGLLIYFIALLHIPLGIVALVAAYQSGNHWRNSWIYLYFGTFALVALGYAAAIGEWDEVITARVERVADPASVSLRDALQRFNADEQAALRALDEGADINTRDESGRTPLMLAANAGFGDVVRRLLEAGADPHAVANDDANALHYGAAGGMYRHSDPKDFNINIEVVAMLLAAGVDPVAPADNGVTPIHGACAAGSIEAVALLLEAGAAVDARPKDGDNCLARAVKSATPEFVRWLISDSGAALDPGGALPGALYKRNAPMFALLLELGADPAGLISPGNSESLAARLVDDDPHRVAMREALIASGRAGRAFANGGARELSAAATQNDGAAALAHLLAMGATPDAATESGDTALHRLAAYGNDTTGLAAARVLIAAGANVDAVNNGGKTPLGVAAARGNLEILQLLLDQGADPNYADSRGNTVLVLAAREGYGYIIEALVAAGAERPAATEQYDFFIASKNYAPGIRSLIAIGLDPNNASEHGNLPLFNIIRYGDADALAALVDGGARLDVFESRYTPLTTAVDSSKPDAAAVLLAAGADPDTTDQKGRSPLEIAIKRGNIASTIALIKHGASVTALQRQRIEERMLGADFRGRTPERQSELRALL